MGHSQLFQKTARGVPVMAQWLTDPTRNHEVAGLILWHRLAATAPIGPPSLGTSICPRCSSEKTDRQTDRWKEGRTERMCVKEKWHFSWI